MIEHKAISNKKARDAGIIAGQRLDRFQNKSAKTAFIINRLPR
jgi:hypothetical protein